MTKDENEPIVACIAFDVAIIDPRNQSSNGLFVFNLKPLDGSQKTQVVNLETKDNKRSDDEIIEKTKEIQKIGKELNNLIPFVASDSDTKNYKLHSNFKKYLDKFNGSTSDQLIAHIDNYDEMIPISDWLHLCKNLRSRFINQKLFYSKDHRLLILKLYSINFKLIQRYLLPLAGSRCEMTSL